MVLQCCSSSTAAFIRLHLTSSVTFLTLRLKFLYVFRAKPTDMDLDLDLASAEMLGLVQRAL